MKRRDPFRLTEMRMNGNGLRPTEAQQLAMLLAQIQQATTQLAGRLDVLVDALGAREKYDAEMQARAAKEQVALAAQVRANIRSAVQDGRLVVADSVGEKSVIAYRESDPAGAVVSEWATVEWAQLLPDLKPKFLGAAPGASVEAANGHRLEVLEVYDPAGRVISLRQ